MVFTEGISRPLAPSRALLKLLYRSAQYERRFKLWGFKKYVSSDDWKAVEQVIDERSLKGHPTVVRYGSTVLSEKRVDKLRRRHGFETAWEKAQRQFGMKLRLSSGSAPYSFQTLPLELSHLQQH